MRRILLRWGCRGWGRGTTSACAENTGPATAHFAQPRNYLRVCGEYQGNPYPHQYKAELPPRVRRILAGEAQRRTNQGTTSACAENTVFLGRVFEGQRNYLRVCGEYLNAPVGKRQNLELPPRVRRILIGICFGLHFLGTTSACAENTWHGTRLAA